MKQNSIIKVGALALVAVLALNASPLRAQSDQPEQKTEKKEKKKSKFGSFIRKVGEATTGINMSDELIIDLPLELRKYIAVEEVTAVGDKATGVVLVTCTVKPREQAKLLFGGSSIGGKEVAYDSKGNKYAVKRVDADDHYTVIPAGTPYKYQFAMQVPTELEAIEMLYLNYIYEGSAQFGSYQEADMHVQLRNIAIEWKAE